MSDADVATRRRKGTLPELSKDLYLAACRAKGAPRQEDRAELLGMPRRSLLRYENSKIEPRVTTMRHIADILGVEVEELWPRRAA